MEATVGLEDLINDLAFQEMNTNTEIHIEKLQANILDNSDTIKKIEDKRRFVEAETINRASPGLKSASSTVRTTTNSSTISSNQTQSTGYGYGNSSYYKTVTETTETKAKNYARAVVKAIQKETLEEIDSEINGSKTHWDMFELEQKSMAKLKRGREEYKQNPVKGLVLKSGVTVCKSLLETLFISHKKQMDERKN